MKLKFRLEEDDIVAHHTYVMKKNGTLRNLNKAKYMAFFVAITFPFLFIYMITGGLEESIDFFLFPLTIGALVIYLGLMIYYGIKIFRKSSSMSGFARNFVKKEGLDYQFRVRTVILDENGIHTKTDLMDEKFKWSGIKKVVETKDHIHLFISTSNAFIFPKRIFKSKKEKKEFLDEVNGYLNG